MKLHPLYQLRWIVIWLLPILSGCKAALSQAPAQGGEQPQASKKLTEKQQQALEACLKAPIPKAGISEAAQEYLNTLGVTRDLQAACEDYLKRFGRARVSFTKANNGSLSVTITTQRLTITSVVEGDAKVYQEKLYGDQAVMQKYADCKTRGIDRVQKDVKEWIRLWKQGCPFASLTVRHSETKDFVGRVTLEPADKEDGPSSAEKATMIASTEWNKGYGTEITGAILFFYAPELYKHGSKYKLPNGNTFARIVNTVRPDNLPSLLVNIRTGLAPERESLKFGALRFHLYADMETVVTAIRSAEQTNTLCSRPCTLL